MARATSVNGRSSSEASSSLGRVDDVEVDRRLLVLAAHRGDEQPLGGPGDRDEEQPGLVVADRRLGGPQGPAAAGHHVDEVLGAEQRAAQPQVGPDALLHAGDDDERPLATGGALRGQQRDARRPTGRPRDEGVAGDVLALDVVEEGVGAAPRQPVDEARGGVEQRDDGVEVAVGARPRRAAAERDRAPASAPARWPATSPRAPSRRVTPGAQRSAPSALVADRAGGLDAGGDRAGDPAGRRGLGARASAQEVGVEQASASSSSLVRPPPASSSSRRSARRSRRSADRVGTADRREHDVDGRLRVDRRRRRRSADRSTTSSSAAAGGPPPRRAPGPRWPAPPPAPRPT